MPLLGFDPTRLGRIKSHFARYVDDGRLPGWQVQISRHGEVAYHENYGLRDMEARLPVADDTLFRIYSMTKPITTVAAMMLYEEGRFSLDDPIHHYLPAFSHLRVLTAGTALKPVTRPAAGPIRILHLLNHTSGLTYGFHHVHVQDEMYRNAGFEWGVPAGWTLEQAVDTWAKLPLRFDPGTSWNYSVSTDVLGRLVEVISGQPLDQFFKERIFDPLGMVDTAFRLRGDMGERLAALYVADAAGKARRNDDFGNAVRGRVSFLSGGGGLVSTTADYHRFTQMLLHGGELDGVRLLGSRTLRYMTTNSLPGNTDLTHFGIPLFAEMRFDGVGFGLGFAVVLDPVATHTLGSTGEYNWGGAASTTFWVDPTEEITVIFMTQLLPSSTHPIRPELRQLVYAALVD
ncbi:MAG TPA: serine hydrolase domain-containing protein [Nevskiaceae bacterium]|nr:serine hydrolase domain-containing protein [Nevskiaceae bacterium]